MTATVTQPAAEVERARLDLREAIDEITTVAHRTVERDDGTKNHFTAPPLLRQVEQELTEQSAKAGAFAARSKPPAWVDAIQFLADVDDHTARHDGADRVERVRKWSAEASSSSAGTVVDAATAARHWRDTISHLLEPQPKMRLRGQACPNCKAEKVWDRHDDGAGENHARPALEIDPARGLCVCLHCDEQWEPPMWEHLVQVLQQQRQETLAATGYDTTVKARTAGERGMRWCDHQ